MNFKVVKTIMKKDIKQVRESLQMLIPMIVVPLIIMVMIPSLIVILPRFVELPANFYDVINLMVKQMPPTIKDNILEFNQEKRLIYLVINYFFGLLFLVIPLMVSSIIAANSFAGEKEKGTIEGLLFAPVTDLELYFAKCLASFVPAILVAVFSFLVYTVVIDILTFSIFKTLLLPNILWLTIVFWLTPVVSFFGLGVTVFVSSKVRGYQEAQQISGIIVLPIIALLIMQISGVLFFSGKVIFCIGLLFLILDAILIILGSKLFNGEKILENFI